MALARNGQNFANGVFRPDMFATKVLAPFAFSSVANKITNSDYLGELKGGHGEKIWVRKRPAVALHDGAIGDMTLWDDVIDEKVSFSLDYLCTISSKISKIDKRRNDVDPMPEVIASHKDQMVRKVDQTLIQSVYSSAGEVLDSGLAWGTAGNATSDILTAEAMLLENDVPQDGNWFLLAHPKAIAKLKGETTLWAQNAGTPTSPFKSGSIGKLLGGMDVYSSGYVTGAGANGDEYDCIMGHRSAITLAVDIQESEYFDKMPNYVQHEGITSVLVFGFGVVRPEALLHLKVQV